MKFSRIIELFPLIFFLAMVGCKKNKQIALPPVSEAPRVIYQGPSTELENQSTSTPIAVETLPEPPSTTTDVKPNIPLPPSRPLSPKPPRVLSESKRDAKPATNEAKTLPTPALQLAPLISDNEKASFTRKIKDRLESAKSLVKSVNVSHLNEEQKTNLAAIHDFIKKSEDAMKRGEFVQSLVLAEKANTLAASISNLP